MKKNKLVWFIAYSGNGKQRGYDFNNPIKFLCPKDEVAYNKLSYSAPEYLAETKLLNWHELDNCNLIQKVIYRINMPNWLTKFLLAILLLLIGAWINSLFC